MQETWPLTGFPTSLQAQYRRPLFGMATLVTSYGTTTNVIRKSHAMDPWRNHASPDHIDEQNTNYFNLELGGKKVYWVSLASKVFLSGSVAFLTQLQVQHILPIEDIGASVGTAWFHCRRRKYRKKAVFVFFSNSPGCPGLVFAKPQEKRSILPESLLIQILGSSLRQPKKTPQSCPKVHTKKKTYIIENQNVYEERSGSHAQQFSCRLQACRTRPLGSRL